MVSFAIPDAVTLSQSIGYGGCLWTSSCRIFLRLSFFAFRNRALSYATTEGATINFISPQNSYLPLIIFIRFPLLGFDTNIYCPATQLWDLVSDS